MKRSNFSEEQIAMHGTPVGDVCRQLGVSEATFYAWKKKYGHLGVSELRRLRGRKQSAQATGGRSHARQAHAVRGLAKKSLRPVRRRELAAWFQSAFGASCVRACRLAQFSRAAWYRRSQARDQSALRLRMRDLAHARPRFGYRRLWVLLRREGWRVNHKRVRRLYRLEGLQVRMRVRRRKHMGLHRGPAPIPAGPTERWAMDFVHDALADGRPFRILTVVDQWSRQSPLLEVAARMSGQTVSEALDRALASGPVPTRSPSITAPSFIPEPSRTGVRARRPARFHSPGETCRKRVYRNLQWPSMR